VTAAINILVTGNCQSVPLAMALKRLLPAARVDKVHLGLPVAPDQMAQIEKQFPHYDVMLVQKRADDAAFGPLAESELRSHGQPVLTYPTLFFTGLHPDLACVARKANRSHIATAMDDYHSAIALHAFMRGYDEGQAKKLFADKTFEVLGYFDRFTQDLPHLLGGVDEHHLDYADDVADWVSRGTFMHSVNHPKFFVMTSIARRCLNSLGIQVPSFDVSELVRDPLASSAIWPVYPALAAHLGFEGSYEFKTGGQPGSVKFLSLEDMIADSFRRYRETGAENIDFDRAVHPRQQQRLDAVADGLLKGPARPPGRSGHPYSDLPDHQFWRRAVTAKAPGALDPVVRGEFSITPQHRVVTAGSCFAQHIGRALKAHGFNYYIPESAPATMSDDAAKASNYGIFSARYGNIYTARQLVQLFDRAYGRFTPADDFWVRPDGRLVDPFRPQIEPNGYADTAALHADRQGHLSAVRQVFEQSDVFVFTLGLTESWCSKVDGVVFPLAPGVAAGAMDEDRYGFVNFTVQDVERDIDRFVLRLQAVNPKARVILTVSPVPLMATYENRHVLVSTTCSKSVLRTAADMAARRWCHVSYFPSYEIITAHTHGESYFEDDLRSVKNAGVDHVMQLFLKHYASLENNAPDRAVEDEESKEYVAEVMARRAEAAAALCDEELLDT
jgi:hypothetical protein